MTAESDAALWGGLVLRADPDPALHGRHCGFPGACRRTASCMGLTGSDAAHPLA